MSLRTMQFRYVASRAAKRLGIEGRSGARHTLEPDIERIIAQVEPFTMTSPERLAATIDAARYVSRFGIEGAVVECGAWAGGSAMAMALALKAAGDERDLYLYDTFTGMPDPTPEDVDVLGQPATEGADTDHWSLWPLEKVQDNLRSTGYSSAKLHFVKGKVEDTIPEQAPDKIALLRLDTDWYESTKHELTHLIDRVVPNGVLIIDDYGAWKGARKAVDEWLATTKRPVLMSRTDYTGRMCILPKAE